MDNLLKYYTYYLLAFLNSHFTKKIAARLGQFVNSPYIWSVDTAPRLGGRVRIDGFFIGYEGVFLHFVFLTCRNLVNFKCIVGNQSNKVRPIGLCI